MHGDIGPSRIALPSVLVPQGIGTAQRHQRAALALLAVRELSPLCSSVCRRGAGFRAASAEACDVVCPRCRCLTLSLNVFGPASNGVAVLDVDMRKFAARLLPLCLGWGARHGSARPSSSMDRACVCLLRSFVPTTRRPTSLPYAALYTCSEFRVGEITTRSAGGDCTVEDVRQNHSSERRLTEYRTGRASTPGGRVNILGHGFFFVPVCSL